MSIEVGGRSLLVKKPLVFYFVSSSNRNSPIVVLYVRSQKLMGGQGIFSLCSSLFLCFCLIVLLGFCANSSVLLSYCSDVMRGS